MERTEPLEAFFYATESGHQPCRDFLLALTKDDRREIGADIFAVQQGFPVGLPLCRKMERDLWEIRSTITGGICRVFFTVDDEKLVLPHACKKKSQKTPPEELETARNRLKDYRRQQQ